MRKRSSGFGTRLAALREAAGLSSSELAARCHLSRNSVGNYEAGRSEPSLSVLLALADALGCDLNAFAAAAEPTDYQI